MAPDDPEDSVYTQRRELQDQLDWLEAERYERPWLALSKVKREKIMARTGRARSEPVQLSRELNWANRLLLKFGNPDFESVEVTINWREPDERLVDSFRTLLRRMREDYGKAAFKVEQARGPKKWPIRHRLFALAVWRCRQCGMTHKQIWEWLEPVRKKLGFSNQRRLGDLTHRIERLIAEEPS
ncbi:MAG TPA: hypothetical protein VG167_07355 [Verrucomicrobiae bacterium]|nr:hypothetical protein [Verrucomicrobiae bacterium]